MDHDMKCSVEICGLTLRARHGVMPEERVTGNTFKVDLRVDYPFHKALESDCLDDTISYADLISIVRKEMEVPSALLEHVAGRIIRAVTEKYPAVSGGKIRIAKLTPPLDAVVSDCAVTVEW